MIVWETWTILDPNHHRRRRHHPHPCESACVANGKDADVGIGAGRPLDAECYEYAITAYKKNVVEKAAILIDFRCRDARLTYECARMAGEIAATRSRGRRIQLKAFKDACEQLPPLDRTKGMFCSGI